MITPWNPSRKRIKRVLNPLPAPTHCPYCDSPVGMSSNIQVYGQTYGTWPWIFLCTNPFCMAYVGMHPFTNIPLGTLADKRTREARKKAKEVFNPLWQSARMTRTEAYKWLASRLAIDPGECHIGWFDAETCHQVVRICTAEALARMLHT